MSTDLAGYISLGLDTNKRPTDNSDEVKQGVVSEKLPELTLEMSDEDIVKLTDKWEKAWKESPKKQEWEKHVEENENYWLGKQFTSPQEIGSERPLVDNLIFESLETYLPQVTRRNPEPLVSLASSETDPGVPDDPVKTAYVDKVKRRLTDLADTNKIRLKLKKAARHWSIYHLGVAKYGWDLDKDVPTVRIIRPKKMILDPDATIDEDGYDGDRIGEYRKMQASKIIEIIGKRADEIDPQTGEVKKKGNADAIKEITDLVKDDMATEVQFTEWWTPTYLCWRLGSKILLKKKNPHWNYDRTETPSPSDMSSDGVQVDSYGDVSVSPVEIKGVNHLPVPKMPYSFLSVFNLGDQPMDKTSLIRQNLSNQDLINKRNKQITKNVDDQNGGVVVSLARSGLTKNQAEGVTNALRKGGTVVIPDGAPREAIDRYPAPSLPSDVYSQLLDTRNRLRDIFGTKGSSPSGIESEKLATGKIMSRTLDTDRIGGGVSEYLEQLADDMYNWFVQLLYVYDTSFQFIGGAVPPKVVVSVKEGSLLPKDSIAIANQAMDLARLNRISNVDLYKRLEYPNPEEMAANVWLEQNAPHLLYKNNPMVQEAMMAAQQTQQEDYDRKMAEQETKSDTDLTKEIIRGGIRSIPQMNNLP